MTVKETETESLTSVLRAVIESVLFDGCFGRLIKLILQQTTVMK